MLRVLGAFNLNSPTSAPAELLRALVLERMPTANLSLHWGGPDSMAWNVKVINTRGILDREAAAALHQVRCGQVLFKLVCECIQAPARLCTGLALVSDMAAAKSCSNSSKSLLTF